MAYAYYVKYDEWIKSEEWTFLFCVGLVAGNALAFLATRWSTAVRAWETYKRVHSLKDADSIRVVPQEHKGKGDIVKINKRDVCRSLSTAYDRVDIFSHLQPKNPKTFTFTYQRDTYVLKSEEPLVFQPLPYPSSARPPLSKYRIDQERSLKTAQNDAAGLSKAKLEELSTLYGKNEFNIPIPSFSALFAEHATAPFFVFQIFCVGLWCLDEYWYYSLFTLFMLIVFECTVVFQVRRLLSVTSHC